MNNNVLKFVNRKEVKEILKNKNITELHISRLTSFFEVYGSPKKVENMLKTIAFFVFYDLNNYIGRYRRLKGINGTTEYTQLIRYGKKQYLNIYKQQSLNKTKHFDNTFQYWEEKELTNDEIFNKISEIQQIRAEKAKIKLKNTSEFTIRSVKYWLKLGYSEIDANNKVKQIQTTNGKKFYKEKYGNNGEKLFNERIEKWQKTLLNKSIEEKKFINFKKGHSLASYIYRENDIITAKEKYYNFCCISRKRKNQNYSVRSQNLFYELKSKLNGTLYFRKLNYEIKIESYRVDFYHKESKTVIEFYGDFYHRNPLIYKKEYCAFGFTSEEKWLYDKNRENEIKNSIQVDNFVIIWENDYLKNKQQIIETCLNVIGEKYVK